MHSSEPSAPRSSMTLLMADDDEDDRALTADAVARNMRGRIVVDPYSVLAPKAAKEAGLDHYCLGAPRQAAHEKA